jgi:hypothetical protein
MYGVMISRRKAEIRARAQGNARGLRGAAGATTDDDGEWRCLLRNCKAAQAEWCYGLTDAQVCCWYWS